MSLNLMVKESVLKGLESMFQTNTRETVKMLSVKYGFDLGEALAELAITETVKVVKGVKKEKVQGKEKKEQAKQVKKVKMLVPKMVLPYCGRVVEEWCEGVKKNHGLYSQCTGEKNGEGKYCKACKKQAEANESGKPTLGNINERMEGGKRVTYAVVMKKLKIEKEEACAEAKKFGLEIPAEEFEMPVSARGRPKKVSESESVSSDESEKKRRGRPKKNKTVAANTTDETDDLIASLVAEANALKSASACEAEAEDAEVDDSASESDTEDEEAEVDEILLKKIHEKINADKTFKKMSKMVVEKKERKKHLLAVGEYIKTLLTEEELALYNGPPEEVDIYGSDEEEAGETEAGETEADEPVEDEATRKAREAAEKKAQVEAEKQQKKEQAEQEKKAKAQEKAQAAAEKKAQVELEKQQKKEQAEQEKKAKQQAAAEKKAQAELEKKQAKQAEAKAAEVKEKKAPKKKEAKPVEAKPVEAKPEEVKAVDVKPEEVKPAEKKKQAEKKEKKAQVKQAEVKPAEVNPVEKKVEEELLVEAIAEEAQEEAQAEAVAEETVTAKVFEFEGKKYLKTEEGILYDQATEECVGVWNEETKSIDEFADEED